jgi:hypothetical protein
MNGRPRTSAVVAVALCLLALVATASATTLTLDTGKSLTLFQGGSGLFTFSATNDAGDISEVYLGWNIGFQVLPSGVTGGSLIVGELFQPAINPAVAGELEFIQPDQVLLLSGSAVINGSDSFRSMSINSTDTLATLQGSTSYNLGSLSFSATPDAVGTWNVYAVQQGPGFEKTYSTLFNEGFSDAYFGNLLPSAGNSSVLIGTISVTAVPEPSSLVLAGSALMAAGWFGWRWRRQPTVVDA